MNKLAQRFMRSLGLASPRQQPGTPTSSRKTPKLKKGKKGSSESIPGIPPADEGSTNPPTSPFRKEDHKGRRFQIINESYDTEDKDEPRREFPKSVATRQLLSNALRSHFLFAEISNDDLRDVVSAMAPVEKAATQDVVRQGDDGTEFFVLEHGKCQVYIDNRKVREYGPGGSFGELALMYSAKRTATIRTTTPCVFWTMDLRTFRRILATTSSSKMLERCEFLQSVEILHALKYDQISKLAGALAEATFNAGDYIIRQGEQGDTFYIIQDGQVNVTQKKRPTSDEEDVLATLVPGQYFGEMALLLDEPRMANCVAVNKVDCLTLGRQQFTELLGPLQDLLTRNMQYRILQSVPLLSHLTAPQLDRCVDAMRVEIFQDGEFIVRQGEDGSKFFIINSGEVVVQATTKKGERKEFGRMGKQEYFGEQSLLKKEPRSADVIAIGEVACFVLERNDFEGLLASLVPLMEGEHKRRKSLRYKYYASMKGTEGQRDSYPNPSRSVERQIPNIELADLTVIRVLGTGTFGIVKLVVLKKSNQPLALKCLQKTKIAALRQQKNIVNEKSILWRCQHPLILELIKTFQDKDQLYMLTELIQGGELWSYIYDRVNLIPHTSVGGFSLSTARFYAGCVVLCIEYVHGLGVAYRDLKPENLLLDSRGYLKMIDFGFAKYIPFKKGDSVQHKSFTLCGTPDYLSPELVLSKGHDKSVDYWALGCLIYELICGQTPFQHNYQPEVFKNIINSKRSLHFSRGFEPDATDLIRKLLDPNPAFRLGNMNGGVREIMQHTWFDGKLDWDGLLSKTVPTPYTPPIADPLDSSCFDAIPDDEPVPRYIGSQQPFELF